MEAEDVIITEEVLVDLVVEEVPLQEEKATLLQDVKVDLEATETQLLVRAVLVEEVQLRELASQIEAQDHQRLQDVMVVLPKDQQDVLKVLVTRQEKEDQEEVKKDCSPESFRDC